MEISLNAWLDGFRARDRRILSRALSAAENNPSEILPFLAQHFSSVTEKQRPLTIGVTGLPGAGKSTLLDLILQILLNQHMRVAVISVDPSSPFSGGALLGDRIRLDRHFTHPLVYIRSLATRGALGGLTYATPLVLGCLTAFGFDVLFFETVGVGQNEVDIKEIVDQTWVVLPPYSGDGVQFLKAGLLEIADLFILTKSDVGDADRMERELQTLLGFSKQTNVPILKGSALGTAPPEGMSFGERIWQASQERWTQLSDADKKNEQKQREGAWVRHRMHKAAIDLADDYLKKTPVHLTSPFTYLLEHAPTKLICSNLTKATERLDS